MSHLLVAVVAAAGFIACQPASVRAQARPFVTGAVGGVYIDAEGALKSLATLPPDERLELLRRQSFEGPKSEGTAARSTLRKVSLRRLQETVKDLQQRNQPIPSDIRYLAGLLQVQYVFFYPEENDVVLAGPAEGWKQAATGEVVGERSNRPVLHLDDLIVALRTAYKGKSSFVGCSIDPTPAGMQNYAAYINRLGGRMDRSRIKQIFGGMERAMGPQAITLYGVPGDSRFALKMVAADYRLKRIALGHDSSPVRGVTNYLDLAAKRLRGGSVPKRQHRWWFLAKYDAIRHSEDRLGYAFDGQGVQVATAPTATASDGGSSTSKKKKKTPPASRSAQQFADSFTKHFPELAKKVPIFAELQNLIGLSVAAELMARQTAGRQPGPAGQGVWRPVHFLDEKACPVEKIAVPKQVASLANYRLVGGRHWLISISGGVKISLQDLVTEETMKGDARREVAERRRQSRVPEQPRRWWWD